MLLIVAVGALVLAPADWVCGLRNLGADGGETTELKKYSLLKCNIQKEWGSSYPALTVTASAG